MKKLLLFLFLPFTLLGQKYDNTWILGYESDLTIPGIDGTIFNFLQPEDLFNHELIAFSMGQSSSSISTENGELLFYTNGCSISNKEHETMLNGNDISPGEVHEIQCDLYGYTAGSQSSLILPMPDNDSIYYIFHKRIISVVSG